MIWYLGIALNSLGREAGEGGWGKRGHQLIIIEPEYSLQTSLLVHVCNFPKKKSFMKLEKK